MAKKPKKAKLVADMKIAGTEATLEAYSEAFPNSVVIQDWPPEVLADLMKKGDVDAMVWVEAFTRAFPDFELSVKPKRKTKIAT